MKILIINAGSSSLKYQLIDMDHESIIAKGLVERIGIENGKLTQPIKDINIIGNGPKALADITMVGNNYKMDNGTWTCGKDGQSCPVTCGMPSALVSKLTVGGEH